jgi:hypothetical protein
MKKSILLLALFAALSSCEVIVFEFNFMHTEITTIGEVTTIKQWKEVANYRDYADAVNYARDNTEIVTEMHMINGKPTRVTIQRICSVMPASMFN